ncbi:MAG: OmpH family outer membrane protein [Candidatus Omnitrophica bacterium]|nr:OmpH family outer membrane protein [Candidatus Omnitrophota bacterium]
MTKKTLFVLLLVFAIAGLSLQGAFAEGQKIGVVDLRKAFYDYDKSKTFDKQLTDMTNAKTDDRNKMVEGIRTLRDEISFLSAEEKAKKQKDLDDKINALNEFDKNVRQDILNKKNDMFKEVIDDIQNVVNKVGAEDKYDYVFDSRSVMYSKGGDDITAKVLTKLNAKK